MSHFPAAIRHVLEWEGGFVDHPDDPGGATQHGISLRWYQTIKADATANDIFNMTRDEAVELYRQHFWRDEYERFFDRSVAVKFFDQVVNMGHRQATLNLQRSVQAAGHTDVKDDGGLGPLTFGAVNNTQADVMLAAMKATQAGHYRALVAGRHSFSAFLNGWLRRALA